MAGDEPYSIPPRLAIFAAPATARLTISQVEVLWALIPIAIFIGAAMPVQRMLAANSRAPDPDTQLAAAD